MRFLTKKRLIGILPLFVIMTGYSLSGKQPVAVKASEVKPGQLRVVVNATTTSTVKSETEVTLSAQRTGRVVALPVKEGSFVKAGALICRLDLTEESVQSESVLAQSKATYDEAEKNLKRIEGLYAKDIVAQQDLDAARRAYEVAKSQFQAATSDASVKRDYSVIRAAFNGVIAKKYTEVGELLVLGKQIVTIVKPDRIYVLATIDEGDVGRLKLGQPVMITVDAFPGETFQGRVGRISPIVSGGKLETRTADVWIYFNKLDLRLKPGMSADIEISISILDGVLFVPSQCVVERDGRKQVFLTEGKAIRSGATGIARLRPVEVGETNWIFTQITKGLSSGDYVITTPDAEGLKSGAKVIIEEIK